ncbi:MAG: ribosome biogenesis GTP-binding protein YihA/YsxC [Myxococcota bacterium]
MAKTTGRTRFLGSFVGELPAPTLPEVAFAGRSNVGKSSALNALLGASVARVSKTPGRTQALNLFVVDEAWIAVDLPGYGYAKVSKDKREGWKELIEGYLADRPTLRAVICLIDARIPAQEMDGQLLRGLAAAGIPVLPVATKVDAITRNKRAGTLTTLARAHGIDPALLVPFSAHEGIGKDEILSAIRDVVREK